MDKKKIEELLKVDLFEELGLNMLSLEERVGLAEDMGRVVVQGIWLKIVENLSPEKQEELDSLLATSLEKPENIMAFLKKEIPKFDELVKEEIANYKSLLASSLKK